MATVPSVASHRRCALPLCGLEGGPDVVLYRLPTEEPLRQAWITFVRRCPGGGGRQWMPPVDRQSFVCSLHFAFNSYVYRHTSAVKKCLRTDAVPTVYPRRERRRIFAIAEKIMAEKKAEALQRTKTVPVSPGSCVHHSSGRRSLKAGKKGGEKAAYNVRQCLSAAAEHGVDASTQCHAQTDFKAVQCGLDAKWSVCTQTSARTRKKTKEAGCCTDDCLLGRASGLEEDACSEDTRTAEGPHSSPAEGSLPQPHRTAARRRLRRCEFCPYTSTNVSHLKRHLQVHTGEKPFKCKDCSMAFKTLRAYQNHVWCHTGEKPYKCSLCPFATSQNGWLERHMNIHKSGKHFVCSGCSYACVRSDQLKRHIIVHTSSKPYQCSTCAYTTLNKYSYLRHVKRRHRLNSVKGQDDSLTAT